MTETMNPTATTVEGGVQNGGDTNTQSGMYVVGPHSVYNSVNELLEGAKQKEMYIAKLEAENAALQSEVSKASNREQFVQELQRLTTPTTTQTPAETTVDSESKLKELVNKVLNDKAEEARQSQMRKNAESIFGNEVEQKLEAKASELGMTKDQLTSLPEQAFYTLVGIKKDQTVVPTNMMQGRQGVFSQVPSDAEAFAAEVRSPEARDPRKMAELINRAMENPSLLSKL